MNKHLLVFGVVTGITTSLAWPKTKRPPLPSGALTIYPGTNHEAKPGDLLFTPMGKSESKFVGHVGMVNFNKEVVHSIPSGLVTDPLKEYFQKFRLISVFSPIVEKCGEDAARYLEALVTKHPTAQYRILTPLGTAAHEQYCTKIVWQSYYYGAGINLGDFGALAKGIHPEFLKDDRYLERKAKNL